MPIQKINALLKLLTLIVLCTSSVAFAQTKNDIKKVFVSQVVDHPALNETTAGIIAGLESAGYKQGINLDLRVESAQGNAAIAAQIANKYVAQQPDVVVGVGTISAQSFVKFAAKQNVNLIFSSVTDPQAASLSNFSGVSNFVNLEPQISLFRELQPRMHTLGVIYNPGEINSISMLQKLEAICKKYNIALKKQALSKTADVAQAVGKLSAEVDAIFINNDNTALSCLQTIVKIATKHQIPVYVSDTDAVAMGALAALGPNQQEIGQQTGRMIARILDGKQQSTVIEYPQRTELIVNAHTAQQLEIGIPQAIVARTVNLKKNEKS